MSLLSKISSGLLIVVMACHGAVAQSDSDYQVELIVVRNLNPVFGTEVFPLSESLVASEYDAMRFPAVESTQLELGDMARRLANSKNFRVISHFAWTQPGFTREEAKRKVVLRNANSGESVSGNIVLSRERYLRLQFDLTFLVDGQQFSLATKRRMISRQVHYFDHPYFGVIAKITPVS